MELTKRFSSLGEFAAFAGTLALRKLAADVQGRSVIGHSLAVAVRERIGDAAMLPPPLADATVADRVAKGFSPNETLLRTGELKRSIGWEHTGVLSTVVGSRDPKAVYHELGTATIPRRPFLAATADEKNREMFAKYMLAFSLRWSTGQNTTIAMTEAEAT